MWIERNQLKDSASWYSSDLEEVKKQNKEGTFFCTVTILKMGIPLALNWRSAIIPPNGGYAEQID
jgi:hypothetical protein